MLEGLTRGSIWLAMAAWVLAIASHGRLSRLFWTAGLGFYLAHILFAYAAFYGWSHELAWDATARDTERVTGWRTGVGLVFNFLFALVLAVDVGVQWRTPRRIGGPVVEILVLFFLVNGAVVFGSGPVRWFGGILSLGILAAWGARRARPAS